MSKKVPDPPKIWAIYDMMEAYNSKQALKLISKLEPKYPDYAVLKAMKAVNLQRTGMFDKAKELAMELASDKREPFDEEISRMMFMLYRKMKLYDQLVSTMTRAYEHPPNASSEFLFSCYLASLLLTRRYDGVQKLGAALFKKKKKPIFSIWSAVSNVLQVPPGDKNSMFLLLSAKMIERVFEQTPATRTRENLWFLISILRKQEKYEEALKLLSDDELIQFALPLPIERLDWTADLYKAMGRVSDEHDVYKKIILTNEGERDNWLWWEGYFSTLTDADRDGPTATDFIEEALALEAKVESNRPRRAVKLAKLHLLWLQKDSANLTKGTLDYCSWLKYKPQSFLDVMKFVDLFDKKSTAFEELKSRPEGFDASSGNSTDLNKVLFSFKVKWVSGEYDAAQISDEDLHSEVAEMLKVSKDSEPISAALEWSERSVGDEAILVACLITLHRYSQTRDKIWLIECLSLMNSIPRPKNNTHLLQWQLLLPPLLGFVWMNKASELDIKQIQNESLGWMTYGISQAYGSDEDVQKISGGIRDFHERYEADQGAHTAWTTGSISKIFELEGFRLSLFNSAIRREAYLSAAASKYFADLDEAALARLEWGPDFSVEKLTCNYDTKSIMVSFLCSPDSSRAASLKEVLLSGTHVNLNLEDRSIWIQSVYRMLSCIRVLVDELSAAKEKMSSAPAATSTITTSSNKKKKKNKATPSAASSDTAALSFTIPDKVKALAKTVHEHLQKLPNTSIPECKDEALSKKCIALLSSVFKWIEDSNDNTAANVSEAVKVMCEEVTTLADKMKESYADTAGITFVTRTVFPLVLECIRICDENKSLNTARAAIRATLDSIATSADAMQDRLRKAKSSPDAFLADLAGTKPQKWLSTESSRESLAAASIKSLVDIVTRISDTCSKLNSRIGKL
eukprot:TRINITY_DN4504_c2_g1_i2.p1 TRINITY_DN4504_c2_g1~~TRINITY_DN4504_c2_g1_i2.p1  ORF type:complete len:914 (+),score=194.07 TRINITY_DN4504_c2_g1_i2:62-2803(+)